MALRWVHQKGDVPLTRTTRVDRIPQNLAMFDFELTPEEMAQIDALARSGSRIVSPANLAPAWD